MQLKSWAGGVTVMIPWCAKCPTEGQMRGCGDTKGARLSLPGGEGKSWTEVGTLVFHLKGAVRVYQVHLGVRKPIY